MASHARFTLAARLRSFRPAFHGLFLLVVREHNAWIHAAATVLVIALGALVGLTRVEWALVTLAIAAVWAAEALNAAIERLGDAVTEKDHPLVGAAKDFGAAGVLACSIGAAGVGLLVLGPRILSALAAW